MLIIEQFLNDNYRLRRNILSGKVEFKAKAELTADYRPLTQEALNSIIIQALRVHNRVGSAVHSTEMLEIIRDEYPNVTVTTKAKVELGRVLVSLEYERKDHSHVAYYKAVPLKAA